MNNNQPSQSFVDMFLSALGDSEMSLAPFTQDLISLSQHDFQNLLETIRERLADDQLVKESTWWRELFGILQLRFVRRIDPTPDATRRATLVDMYRSLGHACEDRHLLLQMMAIANEPENLNALAQVLCDDPPKQPQAAEATISPLLRTDSHAAVMFPRLLDCIVGLPLSCAVLDLANFLTRTKLVDSHPCSGHQDRLARMLSGLASQFEKMPATELAPEQQAALQQQTIYSVGLAVALCDALALIGDDSTQRALNEALNIQHRRIHVEAAAALARFGDPDGKESFLKCAADPVTRLRTLHFAEELLLEDELDPKFTDPAAVAESEVYSYLMDPGVMGIPPSSCELIATETMYWPGYEEPRMCFLFSYAYQAIIGSQRASFQSIAIAGPLVHTFRSNLCDLSTEDMFAAFAGWHAEHPEIIQAKWQDGQPIPAALQQLSERLEEEFQRVQPILQGEFFGDFVMAAVAEQDGVPGAVVCDAEDILWIPATNQNPVTPAEAYCIYKGRRILSQFNNY